MKHVMKRTAAIGLAGVLTMSMLTGCGSIDNEDVVATVGTDKITAGMANFYARMQQAQYETYYAGMMGTTGDAMWSQEAVSYTHLDVYKRQLEGFRKVDL